MCSTGRGSKRQRLSWGQPPKGVDVCEKGSRDGVVSLMVIHECSMSMYGPTTPTELPHVCPLSTKVDPGGEQDSGTISAVYRNTNII